MAMTEIPFPEIKRGQRIGPFIIGDLLSRAGAMARVYKAYTNDMRRLAVKIARTDDAVYEKIIRQEVQNLTQLRHPGIVQHYHIHLKKKPYPLLKSDELAAYFQGTLPYYFAMERLYGGSLNNHYENKSILRYPEAWRLEVIYQVAVTLDYVHSNQFSHLDLNLNNIVFRNPPILDELPQPVIVDFGLAGGAASRQVVKAGTLHYLSPERIEKMLGQQASYRTTMTASLDWRPSDIWSLGVIMYEIFEGKYPFGKLNISEQQLAQNILESPPAPMKRTDPSVQKIIMRMLEKVREDRPLIGEIIRMIEAETPYPAPRIQPPPR